MIFRDPKKLKVFIRPGKTDMRKSWNGLMALAENLMGQDVFSESLFVFCGKGKDRLKILYWDGNGFCLWLKRLEKGKFPWPDSEDSVLEMDQLKLHWILSGIDFRKEHKVVHFSKAN